jgi:hypothetical protein
MLVAQIVVEEVDGGWVVRAGPDVLSSPASETDALLLAHRHVQAIRAGGGQAEVSVSRRAVTDRNGD